MGQSFKAVIVGAGPAGLTAAYELAKHKAPVVVLESDPEYVGGISRTVNYKNFRFDIGGHRFFSKSREVEDLWSEIAGDDMLHQAALVSHLLPRPVLYLSIKALRGVVETGHCRVQPVHALVSSRAPAPGPRSENV